MYDQKRKRQHIAERGWNSKHFERLKDNSNLHTLVLSGTKVTDAGLLRLQQAIPQLKIVRRAEFTRSSITNEGGTGRGQASTTPGFVRDNRQVTVSYGHRPRGSDCPEFAVDDCPGDNPSLEQTVKRPKSQTSLPNVERTPASWRTGPHSAQGSAKAAAKLMTGVENERSVANTGNDLPVPASLAATRPAACSRIPAVGPRAICAVVMPLPVIRVSHAKPLETKKS